MRARIAAALIVLSALAALTALVGALASPAAATVQPRASLTDIENDVMCVSCKEPLAVAQSAQAYAERGFIRMLIAKGQTKSQIEQALVAQYGTAVLGRPPAHGFNLTVYVLPPALVVVGAVLLAFTLPRWRRRSRAAAAAATAGGGAGTDGLAPRLGAEDAQRLDDDLARHV